MHLNSSSVSQQNVTILCAAFYIKYNYIAPQNQELSHPAYAIPSGVGRYTRDNHRLRPRMGDCKEAVESKEVTRVPF